MSKTKILVSNHLAEHLFDHSKYLCGVCKKGVGNNSIFCHHCKNWIHHRCSNIKDCLRADTNFKCQKCCKEREITPAPQLKDINIGNNKLEVTRSFCYLGDVTNKLGGSYSVTLTYQICLEKVLWTNPYSCNKSFSVANRGQMCNYRVISTVLYTCKTWPKILKIYQSCQRQIYRWWDGYPLLRYQTYSVNELREKLKRRSAEEQIKSLHLRWLGHLAIMNIQYWPKIMLNCNVLGAYPSGHPKKNNGQH